ncbi:cytochrome P450 [Actinomadura verrucosospora]|uniref:Cytochrome P450 164A3 Cyp164A3 n=1 Tax=Actinomadura verrucosospora TaxID=46165 RepID=A0A7D4A2G7_ACTVE|nr:cytochrome P450 [Actinomadura verrucosospora]QKG18647.1 cytochrome P450 164A3 Cyp164A3 [Actinomadura verrucosospora]
MRPRERGDGAGDSDRATARELYQRIFAADQVLDDPYPLLRRLSDAGPVLQVEDGVWAATSWSACRAVLRDPAFGIDAEAACRLRGGTGWRAHPALRLLSRTLLVLNPPEHSRARQAVATWFTPDRIAAMGASIGRVADGLLDALPADRPADLIAGFADRLPLGVVQPVLGVEEWPFGDFRQQTMEFNLLLERAPTRAHLDRADAAAEAIGECLRILIDRRRRDPGGPEDLISHLLRASAAGEIEEQEITPLVFQIFNASYQTTASLLGSMLQVLLGGGVEPHRLARDGQAAAAVVNEVLRTDPPVQSTGRHALRTTRLGDHRIPAGDFVVAVLAAGNRDPERFDAPDEFRLDRPPGQSLSFGWGVHYCLGAGLAVLEAQIAAERLAARFPGMRAAGEPRRWPTANMRSFQSFDVLLGTRGDGPDRQPGARV